MEGRWTIPIDEHGPAMQVLSGTVYRMVAVVPCDDAAIERARVELCRLVPDCGAHPQEAWGIAGAVLRAAGETP